VADAGHFDRFDIGDEVGMATLSPALIFAVITNAPSGEDGVEHAASEELWWTHLHIPSEP
jgi:hypothetical protein